MSHLLVSPVMARSRSRKRSGSYQGREVYNSFARRSLPLDRKLIEVEDRRQFHPDGALRPSKRLTGVPARVVVKKPVPLKRGTGFSFGDEFTRYAVVPWQLSFEDSRRVVVCARRKVRKEVLHARGVAGARGLRRPRFNENSKISCKG